MSNDAGAKPAAIFRPQALEELQCIARTKGSTQCRGKIGEAYSSTASQQAIGTSASQAPETDISKILRLLVCKRHSEQEILSQMNGLLETYAPELVEFARSHTDRTDPTSQLWDRNSSMSVRIKLERPIRPEQFSDGFLYAFTSEFEPGFVKFGCCKSALAQRIRQWDKCYPKATLYHQEVFKFPQRIEELIHLELADKRYSKQCNVGSCDSKSHDEWFKCSPAEAEQIIQQWQRLSQSRLYDPMTRQLEDRWKLLLQKIDPIRQEKLTAGHLLEATEKRPGSPSVLISDALASMSL
ncbi:hypothetical protein KCV03_g10099, partial [Aureobasidium melanogenum]